MSTRRRGSLWGVSLLAFLIMFAPAAGLRAEESPASSGTSISPPTIDATVNGGEKIERTLKLSNTGNASQGYTFSVASLSAVGEDGQAAYSIGDSDLASWITVSPANVTLEGNSSVDVMVSIVVPGNASAGGHYATIFAKTSTTTAVNGTGSTVSQMVGANVLLKVSGNVVENAQIAEFSTSDASLDMGEKANFDIRVTNLGNTHISPVGFVELFRDGKSVAQIPVNEAGASVLPNSTRMFSVSSDQLYLSGSYKAAVSLSYGGGKILTATEKIAFAVRGEYSLLILATIVLAIMVGALVPALLLKRKKVRV